MKILVHSRYIPTREMFPIQMKLDAEDEFCLSFLPNKIELTASIEFGNKSNSLKRSSRIMFDYRTNRTTINPTDWVRLIFGSVSFDQLSLAKKSFTFPFVNVNFFFISSKIQDEDISFQDKTIQVRFLCRSIVGEIGLQQKKKKKRNTRYAVTPLPVTPLRGLLTTLRTFKQILTLLA